MQIKIELKTPIPVAANLVQYRLAPTVDFKQHESDIVQLFQLLYSVQIEHTAVHDMGDCVVLYVKSTEADKMPRTINIMGTEIHCTPMFSQETALVPENDYAVLVEDNTRITFNDIAVTLGRALSVRVGKITSSTYVPGFVKVPLTKTSLVDRALNLKELVILRGPESLKVCGLF